MKRGELGLRKAKWENGKQGEFRTIQCYLHAGSINEKTIEPKGE
jgi:hypothetical protein